MKIPFRMCRLPKTIFICALIGVVFLFVCYVVLEWNYAAQMM